VKQRKGCQISGCMAAIGLGSCRIAAFGRRALITVLLLLFTDSLGTAQVLARSSDTVAEGSRSADHVSVTGRRAGDAVLVTLRIAATPYRHRLC
jgi:hypothetical protein